MNFKDLSQLVGLLGNAGKIKEEAERFRARIAEIQAEGSAGGDMVSVRVNGQMEVQKVTLTQAAFELNDREMLEDLIAAATNQAIGKVRELINAEAQTMAQGMGLPKGMNLPGLS